MARNSTTTFDGACFQQSASLSCLTLLFPSSFFKIQFWVQALTAVAALGIYRASWGSSGISSNDGNGGRNGVTPEGDPTVRVPDTTLHAPHWWLLVSSPVDATRGGETESHPRAV